MFFSKNTKEPCRLIPNLCLLREPGLKKETVAKLHIVDFVWRCWLAGNTRNCQDYQPTPSDMKCWISTMFMHVHDIIYDIYAVIFFQILTLPKTAPINWPLLCWRTSYDLWVYLQLFSRRRKTHTAAFSTQKNLSFMELWRALLFEKTSPLTFCWMGNSILGKKLSFRHWMGHSLRHWNGYLPQCKGKVG